MKTIVRYWKSVLREAERELEAATGRTTLNAAAKMQRHLACPEDTDLASSWPQEQGGFLTRRLYPKALDLGTEMATWQTPAQRRNVRRRRRYRRFMSTPRAIGLVLMAVEVSTYGTAPDWLALSVGLLGLAATLFADARYIRFAIARRNVRFLIDRAILLTALALVAAIWLWRSIGSTPL
jgi:hypothetical protein